MNTKTTQSPDTHTTAALPVAVIGAGPVGLAAAAHLVRRGMAVQVFEAGDHVAAHLQGYGHVRLFSPWRYNIDHAARALLDAEGWSAPDDAQLPTAGEVVQHYLAPLARTAALAPHIRFQARVNAVTRASTSPRRPDATQRPSCCGCRPRAASRSTVPAPSSTHRAPGRSPTR